ncbi:hypothetical protein GCM10007973_32610 [Polymorphobacter multimanifer]|uniref:Ferric-dicitrate binding protein FerR (Iron transport regulator) n=1 Tax=Polymorphobacter multimanifer TaxID=1070431 RepID=A0A841LC33_9SPHN|nr:hypothetical protein [Polymorphobacter multimanifer]MBB6226548.1 ferric-dicitrate binding protein FerR (iron transport regulator) [Polymorphobacter multimanifer]GGI93854.1 hypothetical protein GCM10007973_32610 [Polymorphobacter multimanifer]
MTRERALEIVGAYGADPARWPAAERTALLALAAQDADVATAMAEARELDAMLGDWAGDVPLRQFEAQALLPARTVPVAASRRPFLRWAGGGAVAAAFATVLVLGVPGMPPEPQPRTATNVSPELPLGSASDSTEPLDGFALIFTPTADEEELI